jgi:hypothetical protein
VLEFIGKPARKTRNIGQKVSNLCCLGGGIDDGVQVQGILSEYEQDSGGNISE